MAKPVVRLQRNAVSKVNKAVAVRPPNFPQHELPEPYARLLNLDIDEDDETLEKIAAELKQGDADAEAQKLIAMALDDTYWDYYEKYASSSDFDRLERRHYTPSQAVRVLSYMGEAGRAGIEAFLPLLNTEDDYLREELPPYYGAMGEAALEPLARTLNQPEAEEFLRSGAGDCLQEIGEKFPEFRAQVVALIEQALANEKEDTELNAYLVGNLLDLNAEESYPIIAKAFEEDRVDEFIVGLGDVQEHFDMPVTGDSMHDKMRAAHPGLFERGEPEDLPTLDHVTGETEYSEPVEQPFVAGPKPGRNEPCHCGSGKKYKKCHGA